MCLNIFDRCSESMGGTDIRLLAMSCARIASKYEEILVNELEDFMRLCPAGTTKKVFIDTELKVLSVLNFGLAQTCHATVVDRVRSLLDLEANFSRICMYVVKTCLTDDELPFENQYHLSAAVALLVAEKYFGCYGLSRVAAAIGVSLGEASLFQLRIRRSIMASVKTTTGAPRRTLLQSMGINAVGEMEQKLLA